ncbi:IS3 family transposase [Lapidilactobacillus gannanensis]|uniref:IS3 family transposase n=1 Tax=Lapidilactobacillus gannanensis TaxID=2486002 RepID=A0ABW4BMA9_9LACO
MGDILKAIDLKKATYHDERKRIYTTHDKYAKVKAEILRISNRGMCNGRYTYGYRRVSNELEKLGIHFSGEVIRRLMDQLKVKVSIYNCHSNGKYSSYRGSVGKIAENIIHQKFDESDPYKVLHTDVTQVKLQNHKWAYVSAITDEATKEVLALQISESPNQKLITETLDQLIRKLPQGAKPIIHSDQGWHYQLNYYRRYLNDNEFIQSMSRKGNCHDNAPIESFFHIYKTECFCGLPMCKNIEEFKQITNNYVEWFNNTRISMKTKGMSPIEYRQHTLIA